MKQTKLWLTTIATLLCSLTANAHDFEVGGIYYTITSYADLTVEVTYRGTSYSSYTNEYSGAVTIPSTVTSNDNTYSVTSIGDNAFHGCSSLTSITIPESVTTITGSAFSGCSSLTSITIPESVTTIIGSAFSGCSSLTSIIVAEGNARYDSRNDCNAIIETNSNTLIAGCSSTVIPESVTSIGESAFENCSSLTSITIPEGVTSIGGSAFYGCSSLTSITIPERVTSIGKFTFTGCSSLTSITIPERVTSIGGYAFGDCSSLTSITIPERVEGIGDGAFANCSSLTSITIPEGVEYIGYCAFQNCTGELTVNCNIHSGTYTIPSTGVFYKSKFTRVTIGEGVVNIGAYAFYDCNSLYSLTIGSGVRDIGTDAFNYAPKKTIWLTYFAPNGWGRAMGSINYVLSDGSYGLRYLSEGKVYPYLNDMFEVDGVTYVPISQSDRTCLAIDCAYSDAATTINVDETTSFNGVTMKVTEVMPYTFYGCTNLKNAVIGNGVKSIGDFAFSGCSSLEEIAFGSCMQHIGEEAFSDCTNLTEICSSAINPPTCGTQALDDINKWNCTLKVPIGYQSAYMAADQWKEFFFIEDVIDGVDQLIYDNSEQPTVIYDLNGRKVTDTDKIKSGIYIVNGKKVFFK